MLKIGLMLDMPEGKLPGFYAQIVKGLATRVSLFDRDKELLVLDTIEDSEAVIELLKQYRIPSEAIQLILLPANSELYKIFTDYGFTTRAENHFLYGHLVCIFRFASEQPGKSDLTNALQQIDEHLIAWFTVGSMVYYVVDCQLEELIVRIASAYGCIVEFNELQ